MNYGWLESQILPRTTGICRIEPVLSRTQSGFSKVQINKKNNT